MLLLWEVSSQSTRARGESGATKNVCNDRAEKSGRDGGATHGLTVDCVDAGFGRNPRRPGAAEVGRAAVWVLERQLLPMAHPPRGRA